MTNHLYLAHHGIKGQKWGVRRFQNEDGSLTSAGRQRYGVIGSTKAYFQQRRQNVNRFYKQTGDYVHDKMPNQMTDAERKKYEKADAAYKKAQKEAGRQYREDLKTGLKDKMRLSDNAKRNLKIGAAVAGTALAAYGAYKFGKWVASENTQFEQRAGKAVTDSIIDNMSLPKSNNGIGDGVGRRAAELYGREVQIATKNSARHNPVTKVSRAFSNRAITKGKRTIEDSVNLLDMTRRADDTARWLERRGINTSRSMFNNFYQFNGDVNWDDVFEQLT